MSEKNENLRSNLANFIKKAKEDKIVSYEEINSVLSDEFSVEKTEKLIKKLETIDDFRRTDIGRRF